MRTAIEAVIARVSAWEGHEMVVRPLAGNPREELFSVTVNGREHVVRIRVDHEMLGFSAAKEAEATRRAADVGIGPWVVAEVRSARALITGVVPAHPLDGDGIAGRLDDVVAALHAFHDSGPMQADFPVHRVVEWHARDAGTHDVIAPAAYERLHQLSRRIETTFAKTPMAAVPCHNNLVPANLLFEPDRLWLTDFECGGMNDAFFDLANLSVHAGFDNDTDERMLDLYFGEASEGATARLRLMKVMSEFREGMWGVAQRAVGLPDTNALSPEERLRRCERLASRPELEQWLSAAGWFRRPLSPHVLDLGAG
ncbi:MAG: phosphotransferase [Ilumatobacteraceae bacterium]